MEGMSYDKALDQWGREKMDRELEGEWALMVPRKKVHHDGGIDTTKDETSPRSNESERHKRQALADRKGTRRRQCMEK